MNTANKLQKRIMRRVYTAFVIRLATHQMTAQIALFGLALMVFGELVYVRRIVDTLLSRSVEQLPGYVTGAFMHGEVLTLIAVGAMVFVALSIPLQLRSQFALHAHTA